ncbi:unnamed protein product [Cladocopium goreaui]|uniref:Dynein assembly factor 1, axonemal n=1 Tax=Cladocopium goreaui TaxID=2562237 RepID=A0A9P1C0Y3_9DINO|nr:unnamed protein product [Cladocopium goreaui]
MAYEEEDVEWWEVRAPGGLPLRAGPSLSAEVVGEVLRQQRIQVSVAKVKGWLRLAAVETWMTFGRLLALRGKTTAYVPMEDEGFPTVVPSTAPGGDWDQWAALLRWWPLGGVPPLLPATLGGACLCHWRKNPRDGDASIKAHWLRPGEELQFVGPADAKAGHLCRWLQQDMALGPDLEVVLVQDQLALDGCSRLLDHTDMKSVTGPFCALTFARPRLLAAEEAPLLQLAREEAWCLRDGSNHGAVVRAVNRWITSVYDCQASQRLLAFFEELSQAVPAVTVVAVVPGHVPLKEACIEALALTDEARSRARLLRGLRHGQAPEWLPAAEQVLELFSRLHLVHAQPVCTQRLQCCRGPQSRVSAIIGVEQHGGNNTEAKTETGANTANTWGQHGVEVDPPYSAPYRHALEYITVLSDNALHVTRLSPKMVIDSRLFPTLDVLSSGHRRLHCFTLVGAHGPCLQLD